MPTRFTLPIPKSSPALPVPSAELSRVQLPVGCPVLYRHVYILHMLLPVPHQRSISPPLSIISIDCGVPRDRSSTYSPEQSFVRPCRPRWRRTLVTSSRTLPSSSSSPCIRTKNVTHPLARRHTGIMECAARHLVDSRWQRRIVAVKARELCHRGLTVFVLGVIVCVRGVRV